LKSPTRQIGFGLYQHVVADTVMFIN